MVAAASAGGGQRPRCTPGPSATSPVTRTARRPSDWLRRYYLRGFIDRYERWLDAQAGWPLDWRDAAGASDWAIRLLGRPAGRFQGDEVRGVVSSGSATTSDRRRSRRGRSIQVYLYAFPLRGRAAR